MNEETQPITEARDTAKLPAKPRAKKRTTSGAYIALTGLNYGDPEKRVEAGERVDDLPKESIAWLLGQGHIRPIEGEE